MKVVIMGCGRVRATLAAMLDADGHDVTVLDTEPYAFRRLPTSFRGNAMVGNGIDQDDLRRAGIEEADAFAAVTQGDNRNVMACQIAKHMFGVKKAVCRIYDPVRQDTYRMLGLESICPTIVGADLMRKALEL